LLSTLFFLPHFSNENQIQYKNLYTSTTTSEPRCRSNGNNVASVATTLAVDDEEEVVLASYDQEEEEAATLVSDAQSVMVPPTGNIAFVDDVCASHWYDHYLRKFACLLLLKS